MDDDNKTIQAELDRIYRDPQHPQHDAFWRNDKAAVAYRDSLMNRLDLPELVIGADDNLSRFDAELGLANPSAGQPPPPQSSAQNLAVDPELDL